MCEFTAGGVGWLAIQWTNISFKEGGGVEILVVTLSDTPPVWMSLMVTIIVLSSILHTELLYFAHKILPVLQCQ